MEENKLTIEHLAPYLPYNVNVFTIRDGKPSEKYRLNAAYMEAMLTIPDKYMIALRPLSDLTKEIQYKGKRFIPVEEFKAADYIFPLDEDNYNNLSYGIVKILLRWHFDIEELIEKGLAVDMNAIANQ